MSTNQVLLNGQDLDKSSLSGCYLVLPWHVPSVMLPEGHQQFSKCWIRFKMTVILMVSSQNDKLIVVQSGHLKCSQ